MHTKSTAYFDLLSVFKSLPKLLLGNVSIWNASDLIAGVENCA